MPTFWLSSEAERAVASALQSQSCFLLGEATMMNLNMQR